MGATIRNAIIFTGVLAAAGALVACGVLLDFDSDLCWELWVCNISGLIAGFLIGDGRGKNTKFHKAAVVGDTIGDPFKDTSGPALNILIKLMTMISLVFGKNVFKDKGEFDEDTPWYVGLIILLVFCVGAGSMTAYLRSTGYGKIATQEEDVIEDKDMKEEVGFSV